MKKNNIIEIKNISKQYRLGTITTGTLSHDINRWFNKIVGNPDPYLKLGEKNIQNIDSQSGYIYALKNLNISIKKGEVVGIIGNNGAGKSTLLKILSKITSPSSGKISYRGRIGSLLEVGTGFHQELTGKENVFLNGAILGMKKNEINKKFDQIIDFAGCKKYINTPVKRYSSGMLVRLGFAVAAFLEPEILVIDEVLAVGDADFQKKAIGKMKSISTHDQRTVLFVSHNMSAIQSLCSRAILLENGLIVEDGNVDEVINKYLNKSSTNSYKEKLVKKNYINEFINIEDIYIVDNKLNKKVQNIISGSDISICIDYNLNKTKQDLFDIGLQIFDQNGKFVTVMNNEMSNQPFKKIKDKGIIKCRISKLSLMYGKFYITINISSYGKQIFRMENILSVFVLEGDYYKSGKPNSGRRQGVYIEQNWSIT